MARYFQLTLSAGQLAGLLAALLGLLASSFFLGVVVGLAEPEAKTTAEGQSVTASPPTAEQIQSRTGYLPAPSPLPTDLLRESASSPLPTESFGKPTPPAPTPSPRQPLAPRGGEEKTTAAGKPGVSGKIWVQVAAVSRRELTEGVKHRVVALGFHPQQVAVVPGEGGKFRVRLGPFPDRESAARVVARLAAEGFEGAFVVNP